MLLASTQQAPREIFVWLAIIVGAAILLGVIAMVLRKALMGQDPNAGSVGFTLSDLRRLHAEGELTDEQFEQAKARIIAQSRAQLGEAGSEGTDGGDEDAELLEL